METQAANSDEQQAQPYTDTMGFALLASFGPSDKQPEAVSTDIKEVMAAITAINPDDIESVVVVVRKKETGPEGEGFGLVTAMVGPEQLVVGSTLMLQEHMVKANFGGNPLALMAYTGSCLHGGAQHDGEACNGCSGCSEDNQQQLDLGVAPCGTKH